MSWKVEMGRCDVCGNINEKAKLRVVSTGQVVCPACRREYMINIKRQRFSMAQFSRLDPDCERAIFGDYYGDINGYYGGDFCEGGFD